jgi:beta-lactamase regulating signal transducer with metallopeptidase domain
MSDFMQWLWQFNLEVSLLLGFIVLVRFTIRKVVGFYNLYLFWLSVPVALLVTTLLSYVDLSSSAGIAPVQAVVYQYIPTQQAVLNSINAWSILGLVIIPLVAFFGVRLLVQHLSLRRELKQISASESLTINSNYPIVPVAKEGFSPAVYGFMRPKIYFPSELARSLSAQQLKLIVLHEEQHIKQGHLWLNLCWDVLVCFLWFNPLVYIARQSFRHDQEMFCDYLVLKNSDPHDQHNYGHALLSTVSATHSVSLLCSWKMFNQLEDRIMNIKSTFTTKMKLSVAFFAATLVGFASIYSLAMAHDTKSHDANVKVIVKNGAKHKIKLIDDELTYIEEGGDKYVVENGVRREMTAADAAKFEEMTQELELKQMVEMGSGGAMPGHRVISIVKSHSSEGDIDLAEVLKGLEGLEGLEALKELKGGHGVHSVKSLASLEGLHSLNGLSDIDIKILADVDMSLAEQELADALKSLENAKATEKADKKRFKDSARELKEIQKQLSKDQERMEKTREKALAAAKKAREQLSRDAI